MQFSHFVGIDISKETLDAALYPACDRKTDFLHFANSAKGLAEMMSWLKHRGVKPSELLICAEHTGIYTNTLIAFAHKKGIALSLNSPLDIKRSIGLARGKNDTVDAARIAEFAYTRRDRLRLYERPAESIIKLQYLLTERRQYVRQRTAIINLHSAMGQYETASGRARNESAINHIEKLIKKVEEQMLATVSEDPAIKKNFD